MLEFTDICKSFNGQQVLQGVSNKIDSGIRVIIGINGSGKTTLLRIIAGIITCDRGKVLIDRRDVTALPPEKRSVGYVPQHPTLFDHLTAWDNIIYATRNRRGSREAGERLVEMLGLQEVLAKRPKELSGGYKSRVSLARALTSEPKVMLLDEPLSDIDAATKEKLLPEFRHILNNMHIPTIYVTHDLREAESIGDSFTAMVKGRITDINTAVEAFDVIKNNYLSPPVELEIAAMQQHAQSSRQA